jgi:glycosyltransferase involved in cell wall biosynthesis
MSRIPRVSVVVPAFNNVAHIERTLESILAQTFEDLELLVSDHTSPDGTWESMQRFTGDPRVRLSRLSPGGGAERNWNQVTSLARGEFVKLVCGDDVLHPTCLSRQVAAFDESDDVVLVAARRDIIDARGRIISRRRGLGGLSGRIAGLDALRATVVSGTNLFGEPCCVLLRRSVLEAAGGWDGRNPYVIDLATYARVLARGDVVAMPEALAAFRVSQGQWSIALQQVQIEQVSAFHAEVDGRHPSLLRPKERRRARLMLRLRTYQRRLAYVALRRRLQ